MKHEYRLYCALCWQEFNNARDHNATSEFNGKRLNGYCAGDIRRSEAVPARQSKRAEEPLLPDPGEGIIIR